MSSTKLLKQTIGLMLVVLLVGCQPPIEYEEYEYTFDTFPDGTPITGNTEDAEGLRWQDLQGDEFSEWGFLVASTPVSNCVAVRMNFCWTTDNYLALLDSKITGGVSCANARRIEITFIEPVHSVTLAFSGASTNYVMEVYDENGELLGSPVQMGELSEGEETELFPISFSYDGANIKRISFGAHVGQVVVAIREITYVQ